MVNENDLEKILAYELERIKEQGQTKVSLAKTGISCAVLSGGSPTATKCDPQAGGKSPERV